MTPNADAKHLSRSDQDTLLRAARTAIRAAVQGEVPPEIDVDAQPAILQQDGASFVTLTKHGNLRGCIGTMEAYQPLILDVQEHAVAAAMADPRFPKVQADELDAIEIEVSRLTPLQALDFDAPEALLRALRIGVDGVLIRAGGRRATFLPQVWEQLPDPETFLAQLCIKMGTAPDYWKTHPIEVYIYQVEKFCEG